VATSITLTVNGKTEVLQAEDPAMPLLYALRNQLGLHGMHFGCGLAECGACTVHYNGEPLRSCVMPVSAVAGARIVTLEGLGTPEKPHPLQQAFVDEQAAQCGYCINGMIMQAAGLLASTPNPSEAQVREALAGNLCKCGTHVRILRAVMRVAGTKS
jgi:nicotinate dehydrogenase subunit A